MSLKHAAVFLVELMASPVVEPGYKAQKATISWFRPVPSQSLLVGTLAG